MDKYKDYAHESALKAEAHWRQKRHEELQDWGESVLPLLENEDDPEQNDKIACLQFLITSVERGDDSYAYLIKNLRLAALESTRSYYSGNLGSISKDEHIQYNQDTFTMLYALYKAGKVQGSH